MNKLKNLNGCIDSCWLNVMQSQRFHVSILFEILTFEVVMLSGRNRINTIRELIKFDGTIVYPSRGIKS